MNVRQVILTPRQALLAAIVAWFSVGAAIGYGLGSTGAGSLWVYVPLLLVGWIIGVFTTSISELHAAVLLLEEFRRRQRSGGTR